MRNGILSKQQFILAYQSLRDKTEELCKPLHTEDYVIQSNHDTSPPKWHLAHTTWFFETFLLSPEFPNYQPFNPLFHHLFNSYYQSIGDPYPRNHRGLLSRPTVKMIYSYRNYVNKFIIELIENLSTEKFQALYPIFELGLHHEQQHQELLLMDIKHNFSLVPDLFIYHPATDKINSEYAPTKFIDIAGGSTLIGHQNADFCFDNELPSHAQLLKNFAIATKLTTNEEYLEFITEKGYENPEWWLADGWEFIKKHHWHAPLYWQKRENDWHIFTLNGLQKLNLAEPVCHISFYEADAYARFRGKRLPTEIEWEHAVNQQHISPQHGNFLENKLFHPQDHPQNRQFFGDVWEWTASAYQAYPGYQPTKGALGEYNGKFMSNQIVLRGGSCITPQSHIRSTYRNFFQPTKRWQFSGIRLASDG